jgi:hypothetical protein
MVFRHKGNHAILKELKKQPHFGKINNYKYDLIQHVSRINKSRPLQAAMKYHMAGKGNPGHPLQRFLSQDTHYRDFFPRTPITETSFSGHQLKRLLTQKPTTETSFPEHPLQRPLSRTLTTETYYRDTHYSDFFPRTPTTETSFPGHPLQTSLPGHPLQRLFSQDTH